MLHDEWWVDVVTEWRESFGKVMKKIIENVKRYSI